MVLIALVWLKIYDFFANGRRYLALLLPILLAGCFYLCMRHITLNEDIAAFLPYGSGENSRQSQFVYKNLRMQDKVVSLMSPDLRRLQDEAGGEVVGS